MSAEREYVIPLRRVFIGPSYMRAERTVRALRSFLARHLRTKPESILIDPSLNELIWSRGARAGWRRLKVKVVKEEKAYRALPA